MHAVTVSPKFQVVIPREIRNVLGLYPGQEIQVLQYENRIELISIETITKARGFLKDIDTTITREKDKESLNKF